VDYVSDQFGCRWLIVSSGRKFVHEQAISREWGAQLDQLVHGHTPELGRGLQHSKLLGGSAKWNRMTQSKVYQLVEVVPEDESIVDVQTGGRLLILDGQHFIPICGISLNSLNGGKSRKSYQNR
jgi:hypothetical protein